MNSSEIKVKQALIEVGISINRAADLINTRQSYPEAIPVLINLLDEELDDATKECVIRALAVKEAKGKRIGKILISEFNKTTKGKGSLRWAIGGTLDFLCVKEDLNGILEIVLDKGNGKDRQMFVLALRKMKTLEVENTLLELLDDDDVVLHAISALKHQKSLKAVPKIRRLFYHLSATVRKFAKKYLEKYDTDFTKNG